MTLTYHMADDREKPAVLKALERDQWTITHGLGRKKNGKGGGLKIDWDDTTGTIDIGATSKLYTAEYGYRKIAVEVKNYEPDIRGFRAKFYESVGQYGLYKVSGCTL